MNDPISYVKDGALILILWGMLKYMVADKLKQITTALGSHEKRIRKQEETLAYLRGRGCLAADGCPRVGASDPEDDDQL